MEADTMQKPKYLGLLNTISNAESAAGVYLEAWADVTPLGAQSKPIAEGGTALLHLVDGKWSSIDLASIPADPANPLGDQEASPGFLKNLHQKYPQAPMDLFPKTRK